MIDMEKVLDIKKKLAAYAKGWTAHALLMKSISGEETIDAGEFQTVYDRLKATIGPKLTLNDLIHAIAVDTSTAIPWKDEAGEQYKDLVIHFNEALYEVKITKHPASGSHQEQYSIDIKGSMKGDMLKFTPPEVVGGQTIITYDATGGYVIDPGEGLPPITSQMGEPRPIQLNTVSRFVEKLDSPESSAQLALLGTGVGKSFVIASTAEAVGSSVIVVPNKELENEMLTDALKIKILGNKLHEGQIDLGAGVGEVHGYAKGGGTDALTPPYVVLSSDIPEGNIELFKALCARPDVHIVLNARHPSFQLFLNEIKDKLLLIDETHQYAYTEEDALHIIKICQDNVTMALTGSPTGHLLEVFPEKFVDFTLHHAMKAGLLRRIDGVDMPSSNENLVDNAVVSYFRHVYLTPGDKGYRELEEGESLLSLPGKNRLPPCQKALFFSDDKEVREAIKTKLEAIATGTLPVDEMRKYQDLITRSRKESLRLYLDEHIPDIEASALEGEIGACHLQEEMLSGRAECLKNILIGKALSLLFSKAKEDKLVSHLRSNGISTYDWSSAGYNGTMKQPEFQGVTEPPRDLLIAETKKLAEEFKSAIDAQRTAGVIDNTGLSARFLEIAKPLKEKVSTIVSTIPDVVSVDSKMPSTDAEYDAFRSGLACIAVSDRKWATGISIKDVLTTVIVNKKLNFQQPNAVCAPLAGAQAVGRVVRDEDVAAAVTMITSTDIPKEFQFTVEDATSANFGERAKKTLSVWDAATKAYTTVLAEQMALDGMSEIRAKEIAYQAAIATGLATSRKSLTAEEEDIAAIAQASAYIEAESEKGLPTAEDDGHLPIAEDEDAVTVAEDNLKDRALKVLYRFFHGGNPAPKHPPESDVKSKKVGPSA